MATERNALFFQKMEVESKYLQDKWRQYVDSLDEESVFSMGVFNSSIEKRWTSGMVLLAPMIDL